MLPRGRTRNRRRAPHSAPASLKIHHRGLLVSMACFPHEIIPVGLRDFGPVSTGLMDDRIHLLIPVGRCRRGLSAPTNRSQRDHENHPASSLSIHTYSPLILFPYYRCRERTLVFDRGPESNFSSDQSTGREPQELSGMCRPAGICHRSIPIDWTCSGRRTTSRFRPEYAALP